ncbi:MAG: IS110 family transposase [Ardenticatenaceae bacterium]|nr:IS110 family transposase [Ardenticatenaceae bacterium]
MNVLPVGVDMSKATFQAAIWRSSAGQTLGEYGNRRPDFETFATRGHQIQQEEGYETVHLVVEPTGGYEQGLVAFAYDQGWRISLPNPRHVREWAKASGRRAKTDAQDTLLLAHFAAERQQPAQQPLPCEVRELDSLLKRRDALEAMPRQERNRPEAYQHHPHAHPGLAGSFERLITTLEEELRTVQDEIERHVQRHSPIAAHVGRLTQIPGIGPRTVPPLLVLLFRWHALTGGRRSAKRFIALTGLDPQPFQSGASVHKRTTISRLGDRAMRRRLSMAALGGLRGTNPFRDFYDRLVGRGKPKKVAPIAAARKLATWAWAVFASETDFDPARVAPAVSS